MQRSVALCLTLLASTGCLGLAPAPTLEPDGGGPRGGPGDVADGGLPGDDGGLPVGPQCAHKSYLGFGGRELTADRLDQLAGQDRARLKPYAALGAELTRVTGAAPASLAGAATAYEGEPARWLVEPQASAIVLYAFYRVAFDACTPVVAAAGLGAAPDGGSALSQCTAWARRFWSREATAAELTACVELALTGTAAETDVARRWTHVCAATLSSAGFLTY